LRHRVRLVDVPEAAAVRHHPVLLLQAHGAADGAAHHHTGAGRVEGNDVHAAVGQALACADHGQLRGPVHPPDLLRGEAFGHRVEVALGGHLRAEPPRVERTDPPRGGAAGRQQIPERLHTGATGRDDTDAGHDDTTFHLSDVLTGYGAA
jgi:hypothetical protein